MSKKFNESEANVLGKSIRDHRVQTNMTLVELAKRTGVNAAQISRFEHGLFKTSSHNLQIICGHLEIAIGAVPAPSLGARLELFAEKSERNRQAAEQILQALESLIQPANRR